MVINQRLHDEIDALSERRVGLWNSLSQGRDPAVVDEIKASGFEPLQVISDWPGRGPRGRYCAVLRKPRGR